jgi:hypothetical protein
MLLAIFQVVILAAAGHGPCLFSSMLAPKIEQRLQKSLSSRHSPSPQRTTAILKVFRCGPRQDVGGHELAANVDKPRKEEAVGVLDQLMEKVPRRLRRRLNQKCG